MLALIVTILVGLAYYVGLPIWQQLEDGNKRAYETEAQFLDTRMQEMDVERNARWQEIVETLGIVASPVRTPLLELQEQIAYSRFTENGTLLGVSDSGRFVRIQSISEPWDIKRIGELKGDTPFLISSGDGQHILMAAGSSTRSWPKVSMADSTPLGIISGVPNELTWPMFISTDGGENWQAANPPNADHPVARIAQWDSGEVLFILSGERLYRSENYGVDWMPVNAGDDIKAVKALRSYYNGFSDHKFEEHLIAELSDGSLLITRDAAKTWDNFFSPKQMGLTQGDSLDYMNAVYDDGKAYIEISYSSNDSSDNSKSFISQNSGQSWETSDDGIGPPVIIVEPTADIEVDGKGFYFYDGGGLIEEAAEKGEQGDGRIIASFPNVEDFDYWQIEEFQGTFAIVPASFKNDRWGFVATANSGASWQLVPVNTSDTISGDTDLMRLGKGDAEEFVFHYVQSGVSKFLQFDDRFQSILAAYAPEPGEDGDEAMEALIRSLPTPVYDDPNIKQKVAVFRNTLSERSLLSDRLAASKALAAEILGSGYSPAQRRRDYGEFLSTCKTGGASADKCSDTYIKLTQAASRSVSEIIAERAPQAVLLLFLLATLANLYRYNLRLSGFYAARADFLELLEIESQKNGESLLTQWEHAAELANTLAADKVEFGKSASPADQGVALAQSILNRKS